MQIRKKIPILLNILICVPLAIIILIIYGCSVHHSLAKDKQQIIKLAEIEGSALENLIEKNVYQVQLIAKDAQLVEYIKEYGMSKGNIQDKLKQYLEQINVGNVMILDTDKKVILANVKDQVTTNLAENIDFTSILSNQSSLSDMIDQQDEKVVYIATPIKEKSGEIIGVLCKGVNHNIFTEFINSTQIEGTGQSYILDKHFQVVAQGNEVQADSMLEEQSLEKIINHQMLQEKNKGEYIDTKAHQKIFMAYYTIPDIGWTVCVAQNITAMQLQSCMGGILIMAMIIIVVLLVHVVGKKLVEAMSKPIDSLMETMNAVAAGNLESYCPYGEQDEFGALSIHYNNMLKTLGESNRNFDDACKQLTAMKQKVFFDGLTGCLNKATFIESLDAWLSSKEHVNEAALLFIDLDDFKKINDALTHELGDKVLNYVGQSLAGLLTADSFIGRFGGDEFVICKTCVNNIDEIHELVYSILSLFEEKLDIGETKVHLTCSVGIAMYPQDGQDSSVLLKNADTAMYKVKDNGKNSYSFYTKAMSQTLDRRLLVEEAVREGIGKNSFYLQYQPIVDMDLEETVGCEALIRLKDSELGFISPAEFIPIAEESDLIIEIGDWVLENALMALKCIHNEGYPEFTMNINVSSIQIKEEGFLDKLKRVVKKVGVSPQSIKLEVTESVLIEDVQKSIEIFKQIKDMGIKIALDDFGTGYSSLNYLRNIPIDVLKMDKTFIDEITTSRVLSEIVDSIISVAHALDLLVVAEGVEDEMQLEVLRRKGCDLIQGYYYSKPLRVEELEARLQAEKTVKLG